VMVHGFLKEAEDGNANKQKLRLPPSNDKTEKVGGDWASKAAPERPARMNRALTSPDLSATKEKLNGGGDDDEKEQYPGFPPRAIAHSPVLLALTFVRAARELLLPLQAAQIGVGVAEIGAYTAASFAMDTVLVPAAGFVMDKFGRRSAGVPSLALTAAGLLVLAFANNRLFVIVSALLLGIGNGMSNGWIQTVGADLAPKGFRPQFLGVWNLLMGVGTAAGPMFVGAVAEWFSLSLGSIAAAAVAIFGALWYAFVAEETLKVEKKAEGESKAKRATNDKDDAEKNLAPSAAPAAAPTKGSTTMH